MNIQKINQHLKTSWLGKKINYLPETTSTNDWAIKEIEKGAGRGDLFLADFQMAGHGRLGRNWESPAGKNILVSLMDALPSDPAKAPHLTLVAGAAFCDGINSHCPGITVKLKWPNDLFLDGKKMGGVLSVRHPDAPLVVIGIGLNVNANVSDFSPDIREESTSLKISQGRECERELLLSACLNHYEKWRGIYDQKGFLPILDYWKGHSFILGKKVKVVEVNQSYEGVAQDMDSDGFLLVKTGEVLKKVVSGDVLICS